MKNNHYDKQNSIYSNGLLLGTKRAITITSDNKNLETLIDKFRQFPVTATGYTYVELYDGDNLVEKLTSQYFLNEQEIAIYKDLKNDI